MSRPKTREGCLIPDCDRKHNARGLCIVHWVGADRAVKAKKVTWEQLEEQGKALPNLNRTSKQVQADQDLFTNGKSINELNN